MNKLNQNTSTLEQILDAVNELPEIDKSKQLITTVTGDGLVHLGEVSEVPHDITIQAAEGTKVKVYGRNLFDESQLKANSGSYGMYIVPFPNWRLTLLDKDTSVDMSGINIGVAYKENNNWTRCFTWFSRNNTIEVKTDINKSKAGRAGVLCDAVFFSPNNDATANKIKQRFNIMVTAEDDVPADYETYSVMEITAPTTIKSNGTYMNFFASSPITVRYNKSWGMQKKYDDFWDAFQSKGNRTDYYMGCVGNGWNAANFKPKYPFLNLTSAEYMMFRNNATSCPIVDWSKCTYINQAFNEARALRRIEKIILPTSTSATITSNTFGCVFLEDVRFEGELVISLSVSALGALKKESITSLINALSNTTSGLTVSLSKSAVNAAFETSWYANNGSTTDEWLNLVATKENWTISLL